MAGDRGRGRGRQGGSAGRKGSKRGQETSFSPGAFTPATPNNSNGSGEGRGGRGRGGMAATPGRSPWTPCGRNQGSGRGYVQDSPAEQHNAGYGDSGRGAAAVAVADRQLLLVSRDPKMHRHVWELRIHPSRQFSQEWLAAVERWIFNMTSSAGQQGVATPPPPPPHGHAAAAGAAPTPEEPPEMDNDDYDYEFSSESGSEDDEADRGHLIAGTADTDSIRKSGKDASEVSDDDVYDMVSYLQKVSITDDQHSADEADNLSTAATVGSSVTAARGSRWGHKRSRAAAGSKQQQPSAGDDSAAESDSGSWETDSEGGGDVVQQQLQQDAIEHRQAVGDTHLAGAAAAAVSGSLAAGVGSGAGSDSEGLEADLCAGGDDLDDAAAMDAALTAAEEADLLCEPGPKQQPQQQTLFSGQTTEIEASSSQAAAGGALGSHTTAACSSSSSSQKLPKQRRGERKREKWAQQLLVSLRLEKQGLTDKEAQLLSAWHSSSAAAQKLSISKLWLFDNALGDAAATAVATLIGPHTTEIHLSHNQISVAGAKAVLEHVPLQRAKGLKPLWLRVEWNQIDATELRRFIEQDCAARGLVVDIAKELPVSERTRSDTRGRELNLAWSLPWQSVHVQMPWLSCQRSKPEEAAVLQAAKAVWSRGATAAAPAAPRRHPPGGSAQRSQQRSATAAPLGSTGDISGGSSRVGGVVAAMAAAAAAAQQDERELPLFHPPPPPPPPRPTEKPAATGSTSSSSCTAFAASQAMPAAAVEQAADSGSRVNVEYQDGPLMLFVDTSAFLSMLGCPGSVTSSTCFTLKLLQALAGSGRFGRDLPPEQHSFIVLADTVLKQLDSFKAAEKGVGGPVRKFLDKGLDEVGPKGLDFLTVLAAHEGEGLVLDRQAAVAGSRSPTFMGSAGQRSDLAIIEVALFFRTELLAAASAAVAAVSSSSAEGSTPVEQADPSTPTSRQQLAAAAAAAAAAAEAQPVILVTNDNAQLQLAKAHGLPAFKLAGAAEFEAKLSELIKAGGDLTSRTLRQLMAPAATAGLGAVAGRSVQDDFDGAVACARGLLEAYEDLSGVLGRVNMLVSGAAPGEAAQVLQEVSQLLQDYQHVTLFEDGGPTAQPGSSLLETVQANIAALEDSLQGWEARVRGRHTPSRVLKWANIGTVRTPSGR